jgi:hypothetical protein
MPFIISIVARESPTTTKETQQAMHAYRTAGSLPTHTSQMVLSGLLPKDIIMSDTAGNSE